MNPESYLLDTSALLAHYLDEPGGAEVQSILEDDSSRVLVTSVSLAEFPRRLHALGMSPADSRQVSLGYLGLFDPPVPIDTAVAVRAFEIGAVAGDCVPLIDALIASAAQLSEAILVHRDPHFAALPSVRQRVVGEQ